MYDVYTLDASYRTGLRQSCLRSRCRSRTASGPAHSDCSCSGTGTARTSAQLHTSKNPQRQLCCRGEFTCCHVLVSCVVVCVCVCVIVLTTLLLGLVRRVAAVVFAVALPACRDAAARVLAAELVHAARHLGCGGGEHSSYSSTRAHLNTHTP